LPQQVEKFLLLMEKRATAVRRLGNAVLFECADAKSAKDIASHSLTKKLCILAGNNTLVVLNGDEPKFRRSMRILGYGTSE
jgi:hypothetical protein